MDSLDKKTYYFCNSECTKQDFLKYAANQIDNEKISVIHHASSQNFTHITDAMEFDSILKKYGISPAKNRQYIFSFCTAEPRKNLVFTVECFIKFIKKHNITNLYFYFGGGHWNDFLKKIEKKINTFGNYKDKIIRLGYIDDIDVNAFYSNSLFFTYISQYEGFGVPPLEAMMAGTPVITSNNSSLPEVVGDAAITIEYNNEEQCIKAFEGLYFNKDLRTQYIAKGLERAKLFSWEKTVQCMTETITKACENETGA
ncbi:hypothetical protein AGMMS49940_06740 [Spirochaetia bacterium]|nr:hypothetical protein AGMMS49940_06740 [Spirochaetia bacterium]